MYKTGIGGWVINIINPQYIGTHGFIWIWELDWLNNFLIDNFAVQYYHQTDTYKFVLHYCNTTLTGLFTLECAMKMFSYGFRVGQAMGVMTVRKEG